MIGWAEMDRSRVINDGLLHCKHALLLSNRTQLVKGTFVCVLHPNTQLLLIRNVSSINHNAVKGEDKDLNLR